MEKELLTKKEMEEVLRTPDIKTYTINKQKGKEQSREKMQLICKKRSKWS